MKLVTMTALALLLSACGGGGSTPDVEVPIIQEPVMVVPDPVITVPDVNVAVIPEVIDVPVIEEVVETPVVEEVVDVEPEPESEPEPVVIQEIPTTEGVSIDVGEYIESDSAVELTLVNNGNSTIALAGCDVTATTDDNVDVAATFVFFDEFENIEVGERAVGSTSLFTFVLEDDQNLASIAFECRWSEGGGRLVTANSVDPEQTPDVIEGVTEPTLVAGFVEPDHLARYEFEGIVAYVLNVSEFFTPIVNTLFINESGSLLTDVRCEADIMIGSETVAVSILSASDLRLGEAVPDRNIYTSEAFDVELVDGATISNCTTSAPSNIEFTDEPDFEYIDRVAFDDAEVFIINTRFDEFGNFQVNAWIRNNSTEIVDAGCRVELISGFFHIDASSVRSFNINAGQTLLTTTSFVNGEADTESVDRIRLSNCFAI